VKFANVTNLSRLIETQKPDIVRHTCDGVELEWQDRLVQTLQEWNKRNPRIDRYRRPMGKLQTLAERIASKKKELDAEADKVLSKLDELDHQTPQAFDRAHSIVDGAKADVASLESELRQLSNLEST
jgi:chromosome segregation ATPase